MPLAELEETLAPFFDERRITCWHVEIHNSGLPEQLDMTMPTWGERPASRVAATCASNFLDAALWVPDWAGIMDDPTLAGVNSMVPVSAPEYDEAGSWHPFVHQVHGRHFDLRE